MGRVEDLVMIKGQRGQFAQTEPRGLGSIGRCLGRVVEQLHQSYVGDSDDMLTGIPVGLAEGIELFHEHFLQTRFLMKLAADGIVCGFSYTDKTTWKCPLALERLESPLDEKDAEFVL